MTPPSPENSHGNPKPRRGRGNRTGFTTGANAAAAALAAVLGLVRGRVPDSVRCRLPNGQEVEFAISEGRVEGDCAHAVSIKDAGDDPDVTHGAHLTADARRLPGCGGGVILRGGPGVGTVTRPGLGLEVGGPAINPAPRRNIIENILRVGESLLAAGDGLEVVISVPGGEEMGRRTLNARLGILGGISILGTTGIVRPYSTAAFRASLVQAVEVAAAQGQTSLVFTTGGRTEKCAMGQFPDLAEPCFIQMGDFVKAAFQAAIRCRMTHIHVGAMVGKLTKMAQGLGITHAGKGEVDRSLLADCAAEVGAPLEIQEAIRSAETARYAAERLAGLGLSVPFHRALGLRAMKRLRAAYPGPYRLSLLVCGFEGEPILCLEEAESD